MDLIISNLIGKSSAILHSDGLVVYEAMKQADSDELALSFDGITHCTTAFLNACIGKFLVERPSKVDFITFVGLGDPQNLLKEKIDQVLANALNQKKRDLKDKGSRTFFHA